MPINSKTKGKRYELEVAGAFRDYGYDAHRSAQFKGNTGQAADVEGVPGIHIECKHSERLMPYEWMEQAVRDSAASDTGDIPAVFFRKNNHETMVLMRFDDWMTLYREWESGRNG